MRIGAHESIAGGVSRAIGRAEEHGAKSLQIFTKSARGWSAPPLSEGERRAYRTEARRAELPAVAHGSYLVNLASEDPALRQRSLDCVVEELTRANRLGLQALVIHPGCHPMEQVGLRQIALGLDEVHERVPTSRARICLETTAGQGSSIGWRFEQLGELLGRVKRPSRLGICLDTCHLFAAGYDVRRLRGYDRMMVALERDVGVDRVRCLHLNDSRRPLGSRVDRHEEIGRGALGLTVFRCLVNDPRFRDTIAVLETPVPEGYGEAIRLLESFGEQKEYLHAWPRPQ